MTERREIDLRGDRDMAQCHLMPCLIEHKSDKIKALEYFWPTIKSGPVLTASFRGKPLQGKNLQLPEGYKGVVVSGKDKKCFKDFTYWNWDQLPSDEDSVAKALQWIEVSKALHGN